MLFPLALLLSPGAAAQTELVEPPVGERPRLCLGDDPRPMGVTEIVGSTPMLDDEAAVPSHAAFTRSGEILVTERDGKRVLLLDRRLETVRIFGREGPGPGEYGSPYAATMTEDGRVVVLDHGPPSLVMFDEQGGFLREITLPYIPKALNAVGRDVYLAAGIWVGTEEGDPLVWVLRPGSATPEALVRFRDEWREGPPYYHAPGGTPILRHRDGRLFLGIAETLSVAEVDIAEGTLEVRVAGCLPSVLQGPYSRPYGLEEMAPAAVLITDFALLPGGRFLVRTGLVSEGGLRGWLLYSQDGELLREWLLTPRELTELMAVVDPDDPNLHYTWSILTGEAHLVRLQGESR